MFIRVAEVGKPCFQLRKNEHGISVFDVDAVDPPLTETEVLDAFRAGSLLVFRSREDIETKGLIIAQVAGGPSLPDRLRDAHAEIQAPPGMTRSQFKKALQELE